MDGVKRFVAGFALALGAATVVGAENQGMPGATLADDLKTVSVKLVPGYADQRPRLLFFSVDRDALRKKAADQPELWNAVLASAKRLGAVPAADVIATGKTYWRIEGVQAGALAYFVTGEKKYLDAVVPWMTAHCREPVWGTLYRPNLDLQASWYLYHLSIAYDILHADLSDADRSAIRTGLASHAKAIFVSFDPVTNKEPLRYDQNHTYIPASALATAALALQGEVPEATDWLNRAYAILRRSRYALSEDGYYYEGYGYWTYALHWHVRYADLIARATGEHMYDVPFLSENWRFALHLSLPGAPGAFDVGDLSRWSGDARPKVSVLNHAMMWGLAGALNSGESRTAGDFYQARQPERDYPTSAFLWAAPNVTPTPLEKVKPYHRFTDHDVIAWRSGWDEDATAYLFRCGPPLGHSASPKLKQMTDWTMNCGHVHPDIGAFYIYAKGAYLAVSTGYTAEKWTKDHNTLLIDGKGQGNDGSYWNERGIPYEQLDSARIEQSYLADSYAYASGVLGGVYARQVRDVELRRSVLMNKRWFLVIDDLASPQEHTLSWLCHADGPFKLGIKSYVAELPKASLAVLPLSKIEVEAKAESTTVMAGQKPGPGTPTQRGYQLSLTTKLPAKAVRLANLLVPLDAGASPPTIENSTIVGDDISFQLKWADGHTESVKLNLGWKSGQAGAPEPAVVSEK